MLGGGSLDGVIDLSAENARRGSGGGDHWRGIWSGTTIWRG